MKLSEFKNKYGLSGLWSRPTGYMEYEDKTDEVISDIKSSLISLLDGVEKKLPWPSSDGDTEWANGYDKYRSEVVELLSNLKKEIN